MKKIKFEKGILIDENDNYIFIGFDEDEIKVANENPEMFKSWLEIYKIKEIKQ